MSSLQMMRMFGSLSCADAEVAINPRAMAEMASAKERIKLPLVIFLSMILAGRTHARGHLNGSIGGSSYWQRHSLWCWWMMTQRVVAISTLCHVPILERARVMFALLQKEDMPLSARKIRQVRAASRQHTQLIPLPHTYSSAIPPNGDVLQTPV